MLTAASDSMYPTSANEPKVHPLVRKSFAFVPSAGMRLAPEILVLELYREIFFSSHYGSTAGKDLDPDELTEDGSYYYSTAERAVLHALRGRRRKSRNAKSKHFFAPLYPQLARKAWLRKKSERVIFSFLLKGAIAQYLWHEGETDNKKHEQEGLTDHLIRALVGEKNYQGDDPHGRDIFSVALSSTPFVPDQRLAKENLLLKTSYDVVLRIARDDLSQRMVSDLRALCELEKEIPRMQWLHVLMTFLRFSLPMWLLAHMRITNLLHVWLIDAIDGGDLATQDEIESEIGHRNRELLHPTLTSTREIFERTELYIKHRVELSILLYNLEAVRKDQLHDKKLEIRGEGSRVVTVSNLLSLAQEASTAIRCGERFRRIAGDGGYRNFLTREAEQFQAWRDPLKKGQGKNIDEFFRVLYRDNLGDEAGGYLLIPEARGKRRGFRVFPGQLLLRTVTFLAAHEKRSSGFVRGGGKLVLQDVENHFKQYGIDFSCAADARPLLMQELQLMGLLAGSQDAGSSVAVACPY